MWEMLFSAKWRINRQPFWLYSIAIVVIFQIIFTILWYYMDIFTSLILLLLLLIPYIYIIFIFYIKRLHDLDKSGWMSLLILVPFANIYLFIICGFFKWTEWKNQFWINPLARPWEENKVAEL